MISVFTLTAMFFEGIRFPRNFLKLREVRLVIFLYFIMVAGIPFAVHKRVAFDFIFTIFPRTLLYFFILIILTQSVKRLNTIAWVAVISILFSGLFYLQDTLFGMSLGSRISASEMYDPNDIAMIFTTYLPLSLYFLFSEGRFRRKIISIITALSLVIGIMMSGSRGGIVALTFIIIVMLFLRTSRWKGGLKIATLVILSGVFLYYFPVTAGKRFRDIKNDYNLTDEGGRLHIWKQNVGILYRNPISGVGANCSTIALGFHRATLDGLQKWQVTHSSLIQVAVETGIPGFVVFLILNVGAIRNLRKIRKGQDNALSLLSFFLEICFYGFWVGGLFLSHGYSINLYFLLAMTATIGSLSENSELGYGD